MPSLVAEASSVLGLSPGASGEPPDEAAVAAAFKKLAVRWHPDRNPDNVDEATQRFAEISAARDLLLDPPVNALHDDTPKAEPYPKSAHSQGLRTFEGDVTEQIATGTLGGAEAVRLFDSFELWAVWKCDGCDAVCCRIRKNKYSCMCSHRLRDHDAGRGFRCADNRCGCTRYTFQVQDSTEPHKCRCKHKPEQHARTPPYGCTVCAACTAFDSPWVCICGHAPSEHRTAFVRHKYTERAREWVTGGLRGECAALAKRFRARSAAERAAFIQRAHAARTAGQPSWKALQREARLHAVHGTVPTPPAQPHAEDQAPHAATGATPAVDDAPPAERCGTCEPESTSGLTTAELRETLARAGIGVRPAVAADFHVGAG